MWSIYSLELKNFMCFEYFKEIFHNKEIIPILGENQSGKTSILNSIKYALTGDVACDKSKSIIHYGKKEMLVNLTLINSKTGKKLVIQRGRDIKNKGYIRVNNSTKVSDAEKIIFDELNIIKDDFKLTSFFSEGELNSFMKLKAADQKEYVSKWLKNTDWSVFEQESKNKVNAVSAKLQKQQFECDFLTGNMANKTEVLKKISGIEKNRKSVLKEHSALETELDQLDISAGITLDQFNKAQKDLQRLKKKKESYNKRLSKYNNLNANLDVLNKKIAKSQSDADKYYSSIQNEIESLQSEKDNLKLHLKNLKDKTKRYKESSGGICPILGDECDRVAYNHDVYKGYVRSISNLAEKIKDAESKINNKTNFINIVNEHERDCERRLSIEESIELLDFSKKEKCEIKESVIEVKKIIDGYDSESHTKREDVNTQMDRVNKRIKQLDIDKAICHNTLKDIEQKNIKIKKCKKLIDSYKASLKDLQFVAYMFSKRGIPSLELENGVDTLEDEINSILDRMGLNLNISINSEKELEEKEKDCVCGHVYVRGFRGGNCPDCGALRRKKRKDDFNITVLDHDNETPFDLISSGGKTLIGLAFRIGLTHLLKQNSSNFLETLFLDEIDANLSSKNLSVVKNFVTEILIKHYGYSQIFWITHNQNIKNELQDILNVEKEGTESSAYWLD